MGKFHLLLFFSLPFADHYPSFNIQLNSQPPTLPSSTTSPTPFQKHVRNPSRRVHLVSVNPLASYSTWFACFFALFYWAATKPPSVFSNSFSNISLLAKTSKPLLRSQISFFSVVLVSPIRSLISDDWGPRTLGGFSSAYPPKW